jgi:hypothetical protein
MENKMSKAIEQPIFEEQQFTACECCGEESVSVCDYTDEGDPSVGYGPITESLCDECAEHKGVI